MIETNRRVENSNKGIHHISKALRLLIQVMHKEVA
jgi:hypothetical protein